ncbi:hypothetical protein RXV88_06675 [Aestuariicoccus sp. MJ-SS9]|nr:hypothetical protein [Aestuariicoccus sp. MJ-SS9]
MANDNSSDDRALEADVRPDVSALASAVISVLSEKADEGASTIRASVVHKLVESSLRDGAFNADMLLHDLKDNRLCANQIVDIYIPQAARVLGDMWCDDIISFAKVTIATARLQGLLTLLAPPWAAKLSEDGDDINVLMVLQAGDTHTLGPHVATAQLRRLGASVRILFGPDIRSLLASMADEPYDLVMFSCSRTDALETIAKMVQGIKTGLDAPPPLALGGLVLDLADRVKEKTGVDLVTDDVKVAFKLCDKKRHKKKSVVR